MPARRFTLEEEERLRQEYETDWDETWEIADRWGLPNLRALHNLAMTRGWRRPAPNTVAKRLSEPGEFRDQVKHLWDHDASCEEIARYVGISADNTRKACIRVFGERNLVVNHHTYMVKRNRQIHRMRYMGAAPEDLARAFRLSLHTVNWIVRKLDGKLAKKHMGKFWAARKVKPFNEVRRNYNRKYTDEDYEQHEAFLRELLIKAAAYFGVPAHMILWDGRGSKKHANVRQVVAYILHCEVGLTMMRVGELIGRERTTISHTARKIEDKRDDVEFDETITELSELFLEHIRGDMEFVSPYEMYFSSKGTADGDNRELVSPGYGVRIQSRGKLGGSRRGNRDAKPANDGGGQLRGRAVRKER